MINKFPELHAGLARRFPGTSVPANGKPTTLHLYHAAISICSQKVRAVLASTEQPYISHLLDIFQGQTYDPAYVRLRAMACYSAGIALVAGHSGTTSVQSAGCDACVVPTLVVEDRGQVLIDSCRICMELDRSNPKAPGALMPEQHRSAIEAEIALVDNLPNYQLLAVAVGKPTASAADNSFALSKVTRCDDLIAKHADDRLLCAAYSAKRAKEQMAADRLFDAEAMARARGLIESALRELDARLRAADGTFLFGETLTMADLFWGVELIRAEDLGMSTIWAEGRLSHLEAYQSRLAKLSALRHAVIDWPGARLKAKQSPNEQDRPGFASFRDRAELA